MPNINLAPTNWAAEQEAIARRRKMAEMLQQQSMQPVERFSTNGIEAPVSWTQGLAKMLQAYQGGQGQREATEAQKALGERYQSEGQGALARGLRSLQGQTIQPDPQEAQQSADLGTPEVGPVNIPPDRTAAMAAFGSHPETKPYSNAIMAQMLKGEEPYSLAEGAKRMQGGKVVAENPKQVIPKEHVIGGKVYQSVPGGVKDIGGPGIPTDYNKPFTPEGKPNTAYQDYELKKARTGANQQSVTIAQEKEFEKELGKEQAKSLVEGRKNADDAVQIINTVNTGRKILNSGMVTGAGANAIVAIGQALKQVGFDVGGDATANSQAYAANMAQNVGKIIKQFGAGTGLSDADREYAEKMSAGRITLDKTALEKILAINERAARNVIRLHNKRASGVKTPIPLKVDEPEQSSAWTVVR